MADNPANAWTVMELAKRAEVSFQAVAKAFELLRTRGLIESAAGGGSIITESELLIVESL